MEYFFDKKRVQEMLQHGMKPTGGKINLSKLTVPVSGFINNSLQYAYLHESENLTYVAMNDNWCSSLGLESPEEYKGKDSFDSEKFTQQKHPDVRVHFAHEVESQLKNTLSAGSPTMFGSDGLGCVRSDGYCAICPAIRMPVFEGKKAKGVLSLKYDTTRNQHVESLYRIYRENYKDDMKRGNKLFIEYLGLPVHECILTCREIEVLISLAKHRTNVNASRALDLAEGTIATYISDLPLAKTPLSLGNNASCQFLLQNVVM